MHILTVGDLARQTDAAARGGGVGIEARLADSLL